MGILKSVNKLFNKASSAGQKLFQKGEVGGQKLFGKGSVGSHILRDTSKGLNQVSGVARQVGKEVGKFANNPIVNGILASSPYGESVLGASHGLSAGLGGISLASGAGSALTKQKNYHGSAGDVAANILERAKATHDATSGISFV